MTDVVLAAQNLCKHFRSDWTFKKKTVLQDVSFEVLRGQAFGFVGPNGAGKTTTIKILLDLVRPSSGRVRLFGRSPGEPAARASLGYLPERPYLYDHLTARETMRLYAGLYGIFGAEAEKQIDELLELVDLRQTGKTRTKSFSKGMLQRLGLAQALLGDKRLVVLDEPMSGLDPIGRHQVREILLRLHAQKVTVFFSSHILNDVETICDAVAMIFKGRIHKVGSVQSLLSQGEGAQVDLVVRCKNESELPPGLGFAATPSGEWRASVQTRDTNAAVRAVLDRHLELVSLNHRRPSLEEEFMKGVEAAS